MPPQTPLTFSASGLRQLLDHAQATPEHSFGYDFMHEGEPDPGPGLLIVGDHGVYFMSNAKDPLLTPNQVSGETRNVCVYANECNPDTMEFDDWWNMKQTAFGGDDGVDLIAAETIELALAVADHDGTDTITVGFTAFQPSGGLHGVDIVGACYFTFLPA